MFVNSVRPVTSMSTSIDYTPHRETSQALRSLCLPNVYSADPRPTFITDIALGAQVKKLVIVYSNPALKKRKDLRSCLDDALDANTGFCHWASSSHTHEPYHRCGGVTWHGFALQGRWKVISTASVYHHMDHTHYMPSTPPDLQSPRQSGDDHTSYEATTGRLKTEIPVDERGRKEVAGGNQTGWEAVQRLKEELSMLESVTPRSNLSRATSRESMPTMSRSTLESHPSEEHFDILDVDTVGKETADLSEDHAHQRPSPTLISSKAIHPVRFTEDSDASVALEKFQRLAEAVDVGFFDYDPTGKLLHANESWYALSGHPREPEQHTALSFSKCVYPDDEELVQAQWMELMKGHAVTFEMRWKKSPVVPGGPPSAQWVLAACVPVIGEDGEIKSISGCTTDINAQKQRAQVALQRAEALERARASEERFARFAEVAPIAIFRFDRHKNIEYCNNRWFEMTGIPKTRFEEIAWPFAVHDEDVDLCTHAWDKSIADRSIGQIEFRLRREWHDNHGRRGQAWAYCTFFAEFAEDGTFNGLMGSLLDISHLKWAENAQKIRAEDALEAKRQQENFIDVTSHEMRNPLSAMIQCADSIMTSLTDTSRIMARSADLRSLEDNEALTEQIDAGLDAVQTILSCAAHQKRIVDDILTLSKLDSNLLIITPVPTDPIVMVHEVIKMFEADSSKADVDLNRELDQSFRDLDVSWVMLDPSRVSQILINLLGNAIKFTRSESTRQVAVRMSAFLEPPSARDHRITYVPAESALDDLGETIESSDQELVYLKFEVADTGRGLTPEEKERLFLRFSQASPKTHVQYGGSGLGLFISRKLTEMQGGEIGLASEADVGSTFAFYIKTKRTTPPVAESGHLVSDFSNEIRAAIPNGEVRHHLNVLLVEDNLVNQKVLGKQLERQGCTVFLAGHGGEALEFLENTKTWSDQPHFGQASSPSDSVCIDVILMDIEMPVMGGLECTRKIRELEEQRLLTQRLPIISISANARQEQVNEAWSAGVDDTITKPFRIKELMPKLNKLAGFVSPLASP